MQTGDVLSATRIFHDEKELRFDAPLKFISAIQENSQSSRVAKTSQFLTKQGRVRKTVKLCAEDDSSEIMAMLSRILTNAEDATSKQSGKDPLLHGCKRLDFYLRGF